jgi:hypothetical protein
VSETHLFDQVAAWCGADNATITAASTATAPRLLVAAKLGAGKDSVARAVMDGLGHPEPVHVSYAGGIRREVDAVLRTVSDAGTLNEAVSDVMFHQRVCSEHAYEIVRLLWTVTRDNPDLTAGDRTPEIRRALQLWGTGVRRSQSEHYWVKQGLRVALDAVAAGHAVMITDGRFPNEVEFARQLGFVTVRLEVPTAIRAERIRGRDGLGLDPAAEAHPSETALDHYTGFDLRVDNSGALTDAVRVITGAFQPA